MTEKMSAVLDAFWRAVAYCLHPRVILLSLLPLLIASGAVFVLGWFFWDPAVAGMRSTLEDWSLLSAPMQWLDAIGARSVHAMLAPLVVVALAVPVIVVLSLVLVATMMSPSLTRLVAQRRFAQLERKRGASLWA